MKVHSNSIYRELLEAFIGIFAVRKETTYLRQVFCSFTSWFPPMRVLLSLKNAPRINNGKGEQDL